jgi:hypothetical protein
MRRGASVDDGVQQAQERIHLTPLVGVSAEDAEQRVAGVEQMGFGAVVRSCVPRGTSCSTMHLGRAFLRDPQLDRLVHGLDVPVAEGQGEQLVHQARGLAVVGDVAGVSLPVVVQHPLQPPAGLQIDRSQLNSPPWRRLGAATAARRDSPYQPLAIEQQRPERGQRSVERFGHGPRVRRMRGYIECCGEG